MKILVLMLLLTINHYIYCDRPNKNTSCGSILKNQRQKWGSIWGSYKDKIPTMIAFSFDIYTSAVCITFIYNFLNKKPYHTGKLGY